MQTQDLEVRYVDVCYLSKVDTTHKFFPEERSDWRHIYMNGRNIEHRKHWFHFWMGHKHLVLDMEDQEVLKRKDLLAATLQGKTIDICKTVEFESASLRSQEGEWRKSMSFVDELVTLRRKARDDMQATLNLN